MKMESVKINAVERTEKQGKKGMYTIYGVTYNGNKKASTLKMEIGEHLAQNIDKMVNADIHANNNGYMEFFAVEGVEVKQKSGGGGFRKMSPEEQARIDKAMEAKRNGINRSVAMNNATLLVAAETKAGIKFEDIANQTTLYAEVILAWLEREGK